MLLSPLATAVEENISTASKVLNVIDADRLNEGGNAIHVSELRSIDAAISSGDGMSLW